MSPAPVPLSVQLFSIRDQLAADRAAALARLARIGFRYVEPFGLCAPGRSAAERLAEVRALRAALDTAGLAVSAVHAGLPGDLGELVEECRALGAGTVFVPHPHMVAGPVPFDEDTFTGVTTPDGVAALDAFAARMGAAAEELAAHGIALGYHNHWFEWARLPDGTTAWDRFWSRAGDALRAELDVYWVVAAGADPAAVLTGLGERTLALHVKDGPAEPWQPQTPIGTGRVDLAAALRHLPGSVRWCVAEIDDTDLDPYGLLDGNARTLVARGHARWEL
ncbi:sugar phosphate isomerase/epimerase [Streptomyces sp. NPDC006134]|uniref:sugar phosphate isomerase/epimerase family protein n=1 Tax=Streptomyces sp. NPDC006134 TaxID=3154467 RepID=UPI0033E1E04B